MAVMYDQSSYTPEIARAEADFADARDLLTEALHTEFDADLEAFLAEALSNAVYRTGIHMAAGIDRDAVMTERDAERELLEWLKGRAAK